MKKIKKIKIEIIFVLISSILLMSNPLIVPLCSAENPEWSELREMIQKGDLLFMDINGMDLVIGLWNDHVVLYIETHPSKPGDDWFIHAGDPVSYVSYSQTLKNVFGNFLIARVDASSQQKDDAIQWAKGRLGDSYQSWNWLDKESVRKCDLNDPEHSCELCDKFYCTEFVWAAYYYANGVEIDIDVNEWENTIYWNVPCVSPGILADIPKKILGDLAPGAFQNEILIDSDVTVIYRCLDLYGLPAGTQIQLENGLTKPIELIQSGDVVISYDLEQEQTFSSTVTNVRCYASEEVTNKFIVINGNFQVSANHPLYINYWWEYAEDAQIGDKLLSYSMGSPQTTTINTIEVEYHNVSTYKLELASDYLHIKSYFADDILVCE